MDIEQYRKHNLKKWNRIILSSYWIVFFLYVAAQLIVLALSFHLKRPPFEMNHDLIYHVLIPDILVLSLVILTHWIIHKMPTGVELIILLMGTLITYVIFMFISPSISGSQVILTLPIIASILYFSKEQLVWITIINITVFVTVFLFFNDNRISSYELVISLCMFLGTAFIGSGAIERGKELWDLLQDSKQTERDLMVRSIVLDKLTKTDALTGLYNHQTFHEYIEKLIEQSQSYPLSLQLCVLDIDNFKQINDLYGHKAGDEVLRKVAQTIQNKVTQDDIVSRYGGEEFTIVFTGKTLEESMNILESIRAEISETHFEELDGNTVTISGGLTSRVQQETKDQWFVRTDDLLYTAKRSGKNKIVIDNTVKGIISIN